jgi:hypothetical protein
MKRAAEEATAKRATRAVRDSPPHQPNVPTGVFGNLSLSSFLSLSLSGASFSDYISFLPSSSPSGVATAMGTTTSAACTAATDVAVGATSGPALDGEPWTPDRVPKDIVEDSEEEPEVAPEPVPKVVWDEAPAEGAMITVCTAVAPPRIATASGAATGEGMEVVLGHPTPYAPGDISVGEAVSTAHQALSQAQRVLDHEGEDLADERRCLQLWAIMLKRTTVSERATARPRQHGFGL